AQRATPGIRLCAMPRFVWIELRRALCTARASGPRPPPSPPEDAHLGGDVEGVGAALGGDDGARLRVLPIDRLIRAHVAVPGAGEAIGALPVGCQVRGDGVVDDCAAAAAG